MTMTITTRARCPECPAILKPKFLADHLVDRHGYLTGSAACAASQAAGAC